jgi:hypothetical protein
MRQGLQYDCYLIAGKAVRQPSWRKAQTISWWKGSAYPEVLFCGQMRDLSKKYIDFCVVKPLHARRRMLY